MSGFVAIARFDQGFTEVPAEIAEGGEGLLGISLWRHAEQEQKNLVILNFRDALACEEFGRKIISKFLDDPNDFVNMPDGVSHVGLKDEGGMGFSHTIDGSYMFLGNVVTKPGLGDDLHGRLSETANAVKLLPGYSGHARGSNITNSDDVWFFGFWQTLPSLVLPPDLASTGGLYQKVGSRTY